MAGVAVFFLCTALSAASKRPTSAWNFYHFDGQTFVAGPPVGEGAFLAVRDQTVPVLLTLKETGPDAVPLPKGTGAIAGICYIQTAGGKLATGSGYLPCPRIPITISSSSGRPVATVQTDENGYFQAVLAAGVYRVGTAPQARDVTVEVAKTTLVPLRTGKRMVD
ncbi:MAG: hypothetical protein JJE30_06685 [Desulfuromonadales bacterium]|nr:hypothetical protein [Desulfuromonadales bacterium]